MRLSVVSRSEMWKPPALSLDPVSRPGSPTSLACMPYMSTEHRADVRPSRHGRRDCRSQGVSARASLTYFERDLPFLVRRFDPHMRSALCGDSQRLTLAFTTTGNSADPLYCTRVIPPLLVVPHNPALDGMCYLRRSRRAAWYRILLRLWMLDSPGRILVVAYVLALQQRTQICFIIAGPGRKASIM